MSFLHDLITDLREKRLWPVAVALLLALIAVPIILSSSGGGAPVAQTPPVAPVGNTPSLPAVSVTPTPSNARLTGPERNPFVQQASVSKSSSATSTSTGTSSTTSAASGSSSKVDLNAASDNSVNPTPSKGSKRSTKTHSSPSPTPASKKHPTLTHYSYYAVNATYSRANAAPKALNDLERLDPLPHASNPMVVYLGVRASDKAAMFFVFPDVAVSGHGRCEPSPSHCEFLALKGGQGELFESVRSAVLDEFTLSITSVGHRSTTSASVATTARARSFKAGQRLISHAKDGSKALHAVSYSQQTGAVSINLSRVSRG